MALPVLEVAGSRKITTQDWVLAPGPTFISARAAAFLTNFRLGASTTPTIPEAVIVGLSYAARGAEAAREAVELKNGTLKLLGREPLPSLLQPDSIVLAQPYTQRKDTK